ncbi:MAG: GspE/PulE family protein [Patescibacteria group bacterium]
MAGELDQQFAKQRREAEESDAKRRADTLGLPYLNLISVKVPTEIKAMATVSEDNAKKALLVPLQILRKKLTIAAYDPNGDEAKKVIEDLKNKYEVLVVVVSKTSLEHGWSYYKYVVPEGKEISGSVQINEENLKNLQLKIKSLEDLGNEIKNFKSPYTSEILEIVLAGAMALRASDIHLEPSQEVSAIRLRIDGLLHSAFDKFDSVKYISLITRIKLLSGMKLNIHDEPQDGRFTIKLMGVDVEIRTSVIPSEYGETVVMRILDPRALKVSLEDLGWRADDLEIVQNEIKKPNGLILNTGPTGSGKTTTLYAFLRHVSRPEIKIITIEDPIEYHLPNISQTQVDAGANYTFASGLRSILRQDPDVVLVGEIRDKETAEIALNASLTGHLVLSTLHTNDAVGAIPRLIDLGAKTQVLGPGLSLVIAQRLLRVLCADCKVVKKVDGNMSEKIKSFLGGLPKRVDTDSYKDVKLFEPKGCAKCNNLGYRGRTSVFELFVIDEKAEEIIYENPTEIKLKKLVEEQGMVTMQEDGILKVLQGITSLAEVERLTGKIELF